MRTEDPIPITYLALDREHVRTLLNLIDAVLDMYRFEPDEDEWEAIRELRRLAA